MGSLGFYRKNLPKMSKPSLEGPWLPNLPFSEQTQLMNGLLLICSIRANIPRSPNLLILCYEHSSRAHPQKIIKSDHMALLFSMDADL